MKPPRDMTNFCVTKNLERGFVIGVDQNGRVSWAGHIDQLAHAPDDLIYSLNVEDYEVMRRKAVARDRSVRF